MIVVLVTGGLGFVGSTVARRYLAAGVEVGIVDSLASNTASVEELRAEGAIVAPYPIRSETLRLVPVADVVVHCASAVGPAGILPHRGRIASGIVSDTQLVVDYCLRTGARLVNVSTSEVYGFSGVYHEADDLIVPSVLSARIEYAVGKLAAEATVRLTPGLRSVTIRPFNVVGAEQSRRGGFVLPTFAEQAVAGEPLTVYSGGRQERALTSVDDVAGFITEHLPVDVFDGRVVNVGNPANRTSIRVLAEMVNVAAGNRAGVVHTTGKAVHGEAYEEALGVRKIPDIRWARGMGWEPRVGLSELVVQAVDHVREAARGARETEDGAQRGEERRRRVDDSPRSQEGQPQTAPTN